MGLGRHRNARRLSEAYRSRVFGNFDMAKPTVFDDRPVRRWATGYCTTPGTCPGGRLPVGNGISGASDFSGEPDFSCQP